MPWSIGITRPPMLGRSRFGLRLPILFKAVDVKEIPSVPKDFGAGGPSWGLQGLDQSRLHRRKRPLAQIH